jgi:PAS domain S-box-containing protein
MGTYISVISYLYIILIRRGSLLTKFRLNAFQLNAFQRLNLNLFHKGFILVFAPLAFELIFVIILACLLHQAEQEALREAHSKAIITKTNTLTKIFIDAGASVGAYSVSKNPDFGEHYELAVAQMEQELKDLKMLVKDNPRQLANLEHIEVSARRGLDLLNKIKISTDEGSRISSLIGSHRVYKELKGLIEQVESDLNGFVEEERRIERTSPQAQARARSYVHIFLWVGLVLNILLALVMAHLFFTGITGRLSTLSDNAVRLAKSEPLNESLTGNDEIASLDKVFHEMARALEEAIQKQRSIVETMPVGLFIINNNGIIELINPTMATMFAYKDNDLIGKHISTLFTKATEFEQRFDPIKLDSAKHDQKNSTSENIYEKLIGHVRELDAQRWTGEVFPVQLTLTSFKYKEGDRYLCNILDVTERHEIERLKREFVSTVSHELRTPLTSIRGSLSLLALGALGSVSEQAGKVIKIAERNTIRLINLINDLLDVEKLEAGKLEMVFDNVPFANIIERALESVRSFAEQYNITFETAQTNTVVYADGDRLVQVLVNLLSNAVKYSPRNGTVKLSIDETNDFIKIGITDRGRGIPTDFKDKVFERFQQVEAADAKQKGGTGLGLAICKAIIEEHGGTIGVDSEEGKGSTFWFILPLKTAVSSVAPEQIIENINKIHKSSKVKENRLEKV